MGEEIEPSRGGAMRSPAADSGDARTSLRHEQISQHRQFPDVPDPLMAGPTEKNAYVVAVPSRGKARGTCDASAKRLVPGVGRSGGRIWGVAVPRRIAHPGPEQEPERMAPRYGVLFGVRATTRPTRRTRHRALMEAMQA